MSIPKRQLRIIKCEVCGHEFHPWNNKQRFCSYTCSYIGRRLRLGSIEIVCTQCGKRFSRPISATKNHKTKESYKKFFCSIRCHSKSMEKTGRGKNNSNWKGGITKTFRAKRGGGNKLYKKGLYYENKARKELEAQGFYIIRSAASKGLWDIVAINNNIVRFIQVKTNDLPRLNERKNLANFKCPINSTKEIWRYFGMGKKQIYIYKNGWNLLEEGYEL